MSGPWLWLPLAGPIRLSTVVAAITIVAVILWARRSPFLALVAVMAWASVFEIAFQATGTLFHGWPLRDLVWLAAALGGWVLLSVLLDVNPNRWWLLATALVWLAWIATGFESNAPLAAGPGHPANFSPGAEAMNELAKSLLAAAYLVGALRRAPGARHTRDRIGITLSSRWDWMSRATGSQSTSGRWRG